VIPKEKVGSVLPWVHIAISNAKRMLLDIHHDIKPEHLQNYLNEFCYNFNRRYFGEALYRLAKCNSPIIAHSIGLTFLSIGILP
jgi:hypothetical protein